MTAGLPEAEPDALHNLSKTFQEEIAHLHKLCSLRASDSAVSAVSQELNSVEASLCKLEQAVSEVQQHIHNELAAVPKVRAVLQATQQQAAHAQFIRSNLPQHLPAALHRPAPLRLGESSPAKPDQSAHAAAVPAVAAPVKPAAANKLAAAAGPDAPDKPLRFVTVAEFKELSAYTTNRLSLDKVNDGLEDARTLAAATAKLLAGARSNAKMPASERSRGQMLLINVAGKAEVKGRRWFTDGERRQAAVLRQDKTGRAVLTILRQLKRLHEERISIKGSQHIVYIIS